MRLWIQVLQREAEDALDQRLLGQGGRRNAVHDLAVTQGGDSSRDLEHLFQTVGDEKNSHPALGHVANRLEYPLNAITWQVRRWLVQHQDAALGAPELIEGPDNCDLSLVRLTQRRHLCVGVDVEAELMQS